MKYAVVQTGGKQYRVSEGDTVTVERVPHEANAEFVFSDVLLVNDGGNILLGTPLVADMPVKGMVVNHIKGEKIRVSKFKSKVRFRKVHGHRQSLSEIKITAIGKERKEKSETVEAAAKPARRTKKTTQ